MFIKGVWGCGVLQYFYSRMRSRRVPVLRLGSRGPGGDARSLRLCSPSVRKRPQAFASVCKRPRVSESVAHRREPQIVAKRRTVVTFGLVSRLRVSKVSTVTGIRGSWSRNAELSSLLDSSRVFASQKRQQSQGSGGGVLAKRRTVVTFGLVSRLRVSKVSTVTGIVGVVSLLDSSRVFASQKSQGSGGVVVAKRRTVVTFGLVSRLRVSKASTVTGIRGGRGRKTQNCRHFWTRLASSRLKSVNSHRDPGGRGRKTQNCRHFGLVSRLRVSKVSTVTGIGGSWSQNAELLSLLALSLERGEERGERRKER